jgi:hypothetical protein
MKASSTKADKAIYLAVIAASLCVALFGLGVFGYQCVLWLRDGYWTAIPVSDFIAAVPMKADGAKGVQKILDWIWALPASFAAIIVGVTVGTMTTFSED